MDSYKTFVEWLHWLEVAKCHICGNQNKEEWVCERCDQIYCESCSAKYDCFSQIDYNCCSNCVDNYD